MDFGTPFQPSSLRLLLLGSGELGREVVIEAMRLGVEVIACDSYENAPAMQFAHRSHVFNMQDADALRRVVELEKPHLIVPEIEAIATAELLRLEADGHRVIPSARAAHLTMDREGIRRLAAEELQLATSPFRFADNLEEVTAAVKAVGLPCVLKPLMSSSGKGQSVIRTDEDIQKAWDIALRDSRGKSSRVIVEGFIHFDTEITLLTVQHKDGVYFCDPIGHRQDAGDYVESWQPQALSPSVLKEAQRMADAVTKAVGGYGIFGVELFIEGENVYFSEVSPRPHDTGMVTISSQDLTQFELHVRAILGLPIEDAFQRGPSASAVIRVNEAGTNPRYEGVEAAMASHPTVRVRLFGKPTGRPYRRMGVVTARGATTDEARRIAEHAASLIRVHFDA